MNPTIELYYGVFFIFFCVEKTNAGGRTEEGVIIYTITVLPRNLTSTHDLPTSFPAPKGVISR